MEVEPDDAVDAERDANELKKQRQAFQSSLRNEEKGGGGGNDKTVETLPNAQPNSEGEASMAIEWRGIERWRERGRVNERMGGRS